MNLTFLTALLATVNDTTPVLAADVVKTGPSITLIVIGILLLILAFLPWFLDPGGNEVGKIGWTIVGLILAILLFWAA